MSSIQSQSVALSFSRAPDYPKSHGSALSLSHEPQKIKSQSLTIVVRKRREIYQIFGFHMIVSLHLGQKLKHREDTIKYTKYNFESEKDTDMNPFSINVIRS